MFNFAGYDIYQKLYESTHSLIYRAKRDKQPFILKIFRNPYPNWLQVACIKQEYEITRSLSKEAAGDVIAAYDLFRAQRWVMVLEDFGGDSLARLAVAGKFTTAAFLRLAINITQILAQIHQEQICHQDINPSNMVLNPTTGQLKLIDFGISTTFSPRFGQKPQTARFCRSQLLEPSLPYISPEQTGRMNREVDYRTDFYSLGVTFYELLTGRLPFESDEALILVHYHMAKKPVPPHHLKPHIPCMLSQIIMKLMAKNPAERYQTAQEIKADLEKCLRRDGHAD